MNGIMLCVNQTTFRVTFPDAPLSYLKEIDVEWTRPDGEIRVLTYAPGNRITEDALHFYCSASNIVREYVNALQKQGVPRDE